MTTVLQKAVTPAHVQAFLTEGYDRVGGYVVRAAEVSGITSVADLRTLHHTNYEGSPFPSDGPLHILHVDRSPSWQLVPAAQIAERDVRDTSGTVEVGEQLIQEFFLDHTRLTPGARLWRFEDGQDPTLVATYFGAAFGWQDHTNDNTLKAATPMPTAGTIAVLGNRGFVADVTSGDDGTPTSITLVSAVEPGGDSTGFEENAVGHWVKSVEHSDLTALFELRVTANWNNIPVLAVHSFKMPESDLAVTRVVSIARDWELAEKAGLKEVELGVWEATVPASEVQDVKPQETAAQPWMTAQQTARIEKAREAARNNTVAQSGTGATGGFAPATAAGPAVRAVPGTGTPENGTGTSDAAHLALYERIAKGVIPYMPKGADRVQVLCQSIGNVMELAAQAHMPDDTTSNLPTVSQDVAKAFGELRALGPRTGEGPWFASLASIGADGRFTINFAKENQPRLQREVTAEMLRIERERFPRDTWPEWFTELEAKLGDGASDTRANAGENSGDASETDNGTDTPKA